MIEGSPLLLQVKQYQIFPPSNIFQSTSKDNEKFPYWEIYFRNIFKSPIKPNVQVQSLVINGLCTRVSCWAII